MALEMFEPRERAAARGTDMRARLVRFGGWNVAICAIGLLLLALLG